MRVSTILIGFFLAFLCLTSFVYANEETTEPAATESTEQPAPPTEPVAEDKPNPWKPAKLSGLAIGENQALVIPVPILLLIGVAFAGAVGYAIFLIFDSDKQRERKLKEAEAKRAAKNAKKGSKKKL